MIVSFEKTTRGACVAGEWRTAATHEYTVYADRSGRWAAVHIVEFGDWFELAEDEAREMLPASVVAEVDSILKGGI